MLWEETEYLGLQAVQWKIGKCVVYSESQKWKG